MSGLLPRTNSPVSDGNFTNLTAQSLVVNGLGFISNLVTAIFSATQLETADLRAPTGSDLTISTGGVARIVIPEAGILNDNTAIDVLALDAGDNLVYVNDLVDLSSAQTLTTKTLTAPIIATISNTGTLTLPTSTDTLVGRATTDTLENKSLVASTCQIVDFFDSTKKINFSTSIAGTGTTLTLASAASTNRTITFPDVSDIVTTNTSVQTLTNKTLTAPIISTISNTGTVTLPTATDTLVARSTTDTLANKIFLTASCKFADSDVNPKSIIFESPSATANTSTTFRTAQSVDQVITFPNGTGTVVMAAATQTLTNKTLTSPIITNGGTLTLPSTNTTLVGIDTTDTLTNKTLTLPIIASISNGAALLTLPTTSDTLVGRATTDSLTNKDFPSGLTEFTGLDKSWSGTTTTTDASTVTLVTVPTTSNKCEVISIFLMAFCTAGANANTSSGQRILSKLQNVAGTVTATTINNVFSNAFATGLGVLASGTNALVQITGIASNTIEWRAYVVSHNMP